MIQHIVLPTSLNLRAHPRATQDSAILAVMPMGTLVDEIDASVDRSWLRVRHDAFEGWMNNLYLLRFDAYMASPWMRTAIAEFGVAEVAGSKHNPRIQQYLATVMGGKTADETSWCSAFAKWCVLQQSVQHGNIPDLKKITSGARSWHTTKWGNEVTAAAPLGGIVVLWRRRGADEGGATQADITGTPQDVLRDGSGGHVGFLTSPYKPGDTKITLLGGNQSNQVCKMAFALGNSYGLLSIRGV